METPPNDSEALAFFTERFHTARHNAQLAQRVNLALGVILTAIAAGLWLAGRLYGELNPTRPEEISIRGLLQILSIVTLVFDIMALGKFFYWRTRLPRVPSDPVEALRTNEDWNIIVWFGRSPWESFVNCLRECSPPMAGLIVWSALLRLMMFIFTDVWQHPPSWVVGMAFAAQLGLTATAILATHHRIRVRRR